MRLPSIIFCLALCTAPRVQAQTVPSRSHASLLASVTEGCLEKAVGGQTAFRFLAQGATEPIASVLVAAWTSAGKTVYLQPSEAAVPLLVVTTERSAITLGRTDGGMLTRRAAVDLTWWLSSAGGDVLATHTCRDQLSDHLSRAEAKRLAVPGSQLFDPDLPPRSRLLHTARRIMEPAVLLGATAVGTYLLFNLRSRRSDTG